MNKLHVSIVTSVFCFLSTMPMVQAADGPVYRSPYDLAYSPDGNLLAVSDRTAGTAVLIDPTQRKVAREVKLNGRPMGVAWRGDKLYVAEYDAGSVAEIAAESGKVLRRLPAGPKALGVAVAAQKNLLLVSDYGLHTVIAVDLATGKEVKRIPAVYAPMFLAITPDESLALVANSIPFGDATQTTQACAVTVIDLLKMEKIADIRLPPGCVNLRKIAVSPDGKWAYVVHTLGRFTLPTTQLERGWINSNGLTILDLSNRTCYATVLLDQISSGAADPWGIALSPDGTNAWISLAGTHEVAQLKLGDLQALLPREEAKRQALSYDLAALYAGKVLQRTALSGKSPRGLAVAPDGTQVAVAMYFSGQVVLLDAKGTTAAMAIPVGPQPEADAVRRGETAFYSAEHCFQGWLSCATCHPDTRADGLNWDLLNDGLGNPKNTKSMVWATKAPPSMWLGVRESAEVAVEKGFQFIQFSVVGTQTIADVRAYLQSLPPERSPSLVAGKSSLLSAFFMQRSPNPVAGKLSPKAAIGKKVFESDKAACAQCHPAPLLTDLKTYDVGTAGALDREQKQFDTPTLIELWRTAPFLHDGSAPTLLDLLTTRNKGDAHGKTSTLSKEDLDALIEYLLSL